PDGAVLPPAGAGQAGVKVMRIPCHLTMIAGALSVAGLCEAGPGSKTPATGDGKSIRVGHGDVFVRIETDKLQVRINSRGYVSGIAAGSFVDRQTGARDRGFGLHVMDFLLAPGWRDDGYGRDPKVHGNLPKHYVEGPQICTQARELKPVVTRGR